MKIILSKPNKIGDAIVALPMARLLKEKYPKCTIVYLGRGLAKPILDCCPDIDGFEDWDIISELPTKEQLCIFRSWNATHILHVLDIKPIIQLAKLAGIPHRIGNGRRTANWFTCNHLVSISHSIEQHEALHHLKLLKPLKLPTSYSIQELAPLIKLSPQTELSSQIEQLIPENKFSLIIHPGSSGSSPEWPEEYFIQLTNSLDRQKFQVFITGTAEEAKRFQQLEQACPQIISVAGKLTLPELISFISSCDGILAGSTGPLHIGAALGLYALGLFTPLKRKDPIRWQPIGDKTVYLVGDQKKCRELNHTLQTCDCIKDILPETAKEIISSWAD